MESVSATSSLRPSPTSLTVCVRSIQFADGVGGLERAAADHVRGLIANGVSVELVTPASGLRNIPEAVRVVDAPWPRWSPSRGPLFGLAYTLWVRRARRGILTTGGAVVHLHGAAAGVLRRTDVAELGRPAVVNPHGMEEFERSTRLRWILRLPIRRLSRRAKNASRVVATDTSLAPIVSQNLQVPASAVVVIPNAVDERRLIVRGRAGRAPSQFTIVTIGRLVSNKGYDLLLESLRAPAVRAALPKSWRWLHFGSGAQAKALLADSRRYTIPLTVLSGRSDREVQTALASSSLFVQPSRHEGSSLTTIEAMWHGRVIVATPVGGIPDKIIDGDTGFLAREVSASALSEALVKALSCEHNTGRRAMEVARARFSIDASTQAHLELYSELIGETVASRRENPPRVAQIVREFGHGTGVGGVAASLEAAMNRIGIETERFTIADCGIRRRMKVDNFLARKLLLFRDVFLFTTVGSALARRRYSKRSDIVTISHNDSVYGDIQVNHGLLREAMFQRHGRHVLPKNPMHWFTLTRDRMRYSTKAHRYVVSLTARDRDNLLRNYPRLKSDAVVIPNGINIERFSAVGRSPERPRTRSLLGIADGDHVCLFVGHEFDRKGLWIAVDALKKLPADVKLLVVGGEGSTLSAAAEHIRRLDLANRVLLVGRQVDPLPFFGAADSFVLPSAYEANALVLLEALASGLPSLATDVGAASELISDGRNGWLILPDADSIASRLVDVRAALHADADAVKSACRESVADFDWDAVARQYADLIRAVAMTKMSRANE